MNKIFMTKRKYNGEVAVCSELTRTRGKMKSLVVAVATAIVAMAAMPNAEAAAASVVIDSNANAQEKYLAHFFDYDPKGQDEWGNVIGTYKAKSGYLSTPNEFNGERHQLPEKLATFLSDPEETLPSDEFNGAINAYNYNDAGAKFSKPDPTLATRDETKLDDNYSNTLTFTKPGVTLIGTASRGNSFNIEEKDVVLTIQDTDNTTAVAVTGPLSISSTETQNPATKGIGKHTDYTIGLNYDPSTLGLTEDGKLTVISAPNTSGGTTGGGTGGNVAGGTGGSTTTIAAGKNTTVEGAGTADSPYKINAEKTIVTPDTQSGIVVTPEIDNATNITTYKVKADVDGTSIVIGDDGKLKATVVDTNTDKSAKVEGSGGLVVVSPSATTSTEGITDVTTYTVSLNQGEFAEPNTNGSLVTSTAGVATTTDVVNAVNKGSFKTQVDGRDDKQVKFGDTVNFVDGSGVDVTRKTDGSITFNALVDGTTIKVGEDGKLTVISAPTTTGGGTATKIAAGKNTTVEGAGTADSPYKIHAEKTIVTPDTQSGIVVAPETDNATNITTYKVKADVDGTSIVIGDDGKLKATVVDTDKSAKVEGSDLVTVTPSATSSKEGITDVTTYTVAVKKGTFAANDGGKLGNVATDANGVATVTDVITAVNQTGFKLKTSATADGINTTADNDLKTNGELINPADTVEMVAGKNLTVKQEENGKITYATKDDVEFTTVKVGKDENGKKPVELKTEAASTASNNPADKTPTTALSISSDGKPTQLTGVGSVLNTQDVNTNPDGKADTPAPTDVKLVNLVGDTINSNAAATVGDLQNMGWVVSATGNEYKDTVKNANQVDFKGTGLAKVTGETDANGVRTITVDVKAAEVDMPVIYTDADGNKLVKGEDGKFYKADELKDAVYDPVAKTYKKDGAEIVAVDNSNVIASMNDGDNTADTPKSLSNVKGNLTPTYNVGDSKIGAAGSTNEGKPTDETATTATTSEVAPDVDSVKAMYNNAATVGDVLNAGFNLKANDDAVDFVKPYDTVKFQDGFGTLVTTQTDVEGKETTIQIDIANGYITPDEDTSGKVKGPVTGDKTADQLVEAIYAAEDELAAAEQELTADPDNETKKQAVEAAKTKVAEAHKAADDAGLNLVATAQNVADAINKSGFTLKAAENGGTNDTTDNDLKTNGELINPGDVVTMQAGKNMTVTHEADGKITYATKDDVEFTTVKVGKDENGKKPVELKTEAATAASNNPADKTPTTALSISSDGKPTQLTGVGSVLNTQDVNTDPDGNKADGTAAAPVKLVNLTETGVNPNAAATVGDLQNMGWVVKASSNEYSDVVKNANEVEFKGVGLDVSGETAADGKRVITIKALDPNNMLTELIAELENNPGGTGTAQPTGKIAIQKDGNASGYANAGNVKDMVNAAGWQLLADGERKELINAGDRVNFTKGTGTTVNVTPTTEGDKLTGATVSFNVDTGTIAVETKENKETGKVVGSELAKGKTLAEAEQALKEAKDALTALGENADTAAKEAATAKVAEAQKVVDAFNKVATVENVVNAINNAGWNVKAAADGGSVSGTAADELVKAGETVELKAGKNINIKQDGQNFTFSTVENPDFTTVTVGSPTYQDAQGNPVSKKGDKFYNEQGQEVPADQVTSTTPAVTFKADTATAANVNPTDKTPSTALNITSVDGKPTQITGVGSVLNTQDVDTNPDGKADTPAPTDVKLVNLVGDTINSNAAATVGDLQNMGWIVSTKDGNGYLDTVKNANQVDFKGTGLATVKGETVNGVRTITVDVNAQKTVEAADTPVIYTDKDGNKLIKVGNDFYPADSVVSSDGKVYPKDTPLDNKGLAAADIPTANPVEKANVIASMNDGDNKADTPKQLSNVKGNLTPTYNVGDNEIAANGDNAGKPTDTKVTQATKSEVAPTVENVKAMYNNAATVGDVLNAGFNLKANDDAVDFVKPYDTVNFANGTGTLVDVSTDADGKVSTIKVNVDKGEIALEKTGTAADAKETGKVLGSELAKGKTPEQAEKALADAKAELAKLGENAEQAAKEAATAKVAEAQKVVDAFNKVATVENVVNAINNAGWNVKAVADGGSVSGTAADELVKAGETVELKAGKNINIKQDGQNFTFSTVENPDFTTVTVGSPTYQDAQGNPVSKKGDKFYNEQGQEVPADQVTSTTPAVTFKADTATAANVNPTDKTPSTALNITSVDGKPTQITGVGSVLNTTTVNTNPDGKADTPVTENKLVDLTGTDTAPVNKTAAATVGDLQNMGWIVSAAGNEYKDTVKNANEVEFKGVGLDVSGETAADGKRVITIKALDSNNTVQINAGKNIEVTRGDQNVTIATSMTPDFTTVNATDSIAVTNGPSMSVSGIDAAGKQITNVAAGVAPTDAVNVSQLKGLTANIDNRIDDVELDARRGAALAGALGMLPQPHISGKSMFSAAATTYSGEQVVAVGYSRLSDNGQHIIKFSGSTNLQGSRKAMMGVAYGYQY